MSTIGEFLTGAVKSFIQTIFDATGAYFAEQHRVFVLLLDYGWFPDTAATCFLLPKLQTYVDLGQVDRAERLYRKFCLRMYNKSYLAELVNAWEEDHSLLERRIHILRQAVDAHCRGQYDLSVPVLMCQIEGFIWDAKQHKGRIPQRKLRVTLRELNISPLTIDFIEKHLLAEFEYGQALETNLSRNAVLHGYDTQYGTITTSLKLIMLINLLVTIID